MNNKSFVDEIDINTIHSNDEINRIVKMWYERAILRSYHSADPISFKEGFVTALTVLTGGHYKGMTYDSNGCDCAKPDCENCRF